MKLTKCNNGHYYDADQFSTCPHCSSGSVNTDAVTMALSGGDDPVTVANPSGGSAFAGRNSISLNEAISIVEAGPKLDTDDNKTVSYYSNTVGTEPVVGWLVCTEGKYFGQSFSLKSGRNFIGRSPSMDVALDGDSSISREKHAIIIYEPKGRVFFAQPGESRELFYLNDKVVLTNEVLHPYDVFTIGNTKLLFIPCCCEKFAWEDVKQEEEDS